MASRESFPSRGGGHMTPLWNILDQERQVLYAYTIKAPKGAIKGPYCHRKRTGLLYVLSGSVHVKIIKDIELECKDTVLSTSDKEIEYVVIPNGVIYTIEVLEDCILLNLCDYPWNEFENENCV